MNNFEHIPWLQALVKDTESVIHEIFETTGSAALKELLKSQHSGGKRLRPMVVGASAQLGDNETQALAYGSAAIELFHLASLFHDDVLDRTESRRNRLTSQKEVGISKSVLTGDYLLAGSIHLMVKHLPAEVVRYFLDTIQLMIRSEITSNKLQYNWDITSKEYFDIIANKTAVLFAMAASIGIRLTSSDQTAIRHMSAFGHQLGIAYQLVDDLEDLMGVIEDSDNDLANGYFSLPMIELLNAAPKHNKTDIKKYVQNLNETNRIHLLKLMRTFSIFKTMIAQIQKHLDAAKKELKYFEAGESKKDSALAVLAGLCEQVSQKAHKIVRTYESMADRKMAEPPKKKLAIA
ncbi:polyprenyl synthetase family protein [bacterium]|nr:polyprenyl synthetase family protein [bacterium]